MPVMNKRILIAVLAIAALGVGGTAIAGATGGGDDNENDQAITGSALDRASAAALQATGGGKVTETEVGDLLDDPVEAHLVRQLVRLRSARQLDDIRHERGQLVQLLDDVVAQRLDLARR